MFLNLTVLVLSCNFPPFGIKATCSHFCEGPAQDLLCCSDLLSEASWSNVMFMAASENNSISYF